MESLLNQSFIDIKEDFEELKYLYNDYLDKLSSFNRELENKILDIPLYQNNKKITNKYLDELNNQILKLENIHKKIHKSKTTKDLEYLIKHKKDFYEFLRNSSISYSALITSTDWQSPSFKHSLYSMAGRQTGKIIHTISDYKRDIHLDEKYYENLFLKEYVDTRFKLNTHIYAVNSGMATFITILTFLITENKIKEKILIGKSIYFQNKEIIKRFFPDRVIEADDNNEEEIIKLIKKHKPSLIIFDTICNSFNIAMPNLTKVLDFLVKYVNTDTNIIIDNTCLPFYYQPLKHIKGKNKHLSLFVLESLNKYYQFGMDRVTGGIIIGYGKDTGKLYYSRQNSGTNISDISVNTLPSPSKYYLKKRLLRFERNANYLANDLQEFIDHNHTSFNKVNYPTLINHPAYKWNQKYQFHGSSLSLEFKRNKSSIRSYKNFINKIINSAKANNVQISAGTSFGFNNTRIYLTSLRSDFGTPFIRISVGTESLYEINKIKNVFIKTMESF